MKSKLVRILFSAAVALLLVKSGVSAAIYLWPKPESDNTGNAAALELIRLTNDYRRELGLSELIINPRLTQAAINKAKDILAKQYFSHSSPEGKKFSDWVKEVNYSYFYVGENLAIDFADPREVFTAWLKSPKHKENIDRQEFQEIGIADLKGKFDGRETDVVVQLFGSRVLGEDERSANGGNQQLAKNYFAPLADASSTLDYFGLIDQYLNYILFLLVLFLIVAVIARKIRRKKPARIATRNVAGGLPTQIEPAASDRTIDIKRISAKKQVAPLVSLYTKQTLRASGRSRTSKNTSPTDSQK